MSDIKSEKKLLIVSRTFPPFTVGSAILLNNLFKSYKGNFQALACWQYEAKIDPSFSPPCKTHYLKMPSSLLQRIYDRFQHRLIFLDKAFMRYKMKSIKPSCVLLVYPNPSFLVAAFQICQELKIPYLLDMHDLWEENYSVNHPRGLLAQKWEKIIFEFVSGCQSRTLHFELTHNFACQTL
jgi:hypothetical protein